ncbi:uncharacterized protein LOC110103088 [Dendrobium catenatum]|uniref:uncharacterized protein LOC110103088 n=1 Tax=Dendrobium catenatum TaxID=906689 RepID=UPI0009F35117|nr:uncharacterized protein LOC110103088 [Dendrobium catenatum]
MELKFKYSGRSIAALAFQAVTEQSEGTAHWMWMKELKLRPNIELFWWRLCNDAIPSNDFLFRRRLNNFSRCPRGCKEEENGCHIAGKCDKLRTVISILNGWGFQVPFFDNISECLEGLKKLVGKKSLIANMYCTTTRLVWKSRCKLIHDGIEDSVNSLAANAVSTSTVCNFINSYSDNWDVNQRKLFCSWHPPPPGWIKINVDASLLRNNVAGFGGVARDDKGRFLIAFGAKLMHWDIAQMELMAVLYLKNIIRDWMIEAQGVIIEGDNFNIIKILRLVMKTWKVSKIIDDNLAFLLDFNQVLFSFSNRDCNKLADVCANLALKKSFIWEDLSFEEIPPSFLFCLKEEYDL